jgi:HK97 gp10 family phage protein
MAIPSPIKIKKGSVEIVSSVDRCNYTIEELSRSALRDVGKFIRKRMIQKLKELPGMRKHRRIYASTQYWNRKRDADLQIGFKHDTWYGVRQELGTHGQPARNILRETVFENIPEIVKIESLYLSSLEDEAKALALIDEDDEGKEGNKEND